MLFGPCVQDAGASFLTGVGRSAAAAPASSRR